MLWLVLGLAALALWAVLWPRMEAIMAAQQQGRPAPEGMLVVIKVLTTVVMVAVYLLLPLGFFLFYRSPHTKATCEWRNPEPSWTDRVPVPVLALALGLTVSGLAMLGTAVQGVFPVFGFLLTGAAAAAVSLIAGAALLVLARGACALNPAAWWGALALTVAGFSSGLVSFVRVPLDEIYARTYPPEQLELMRQFNPWTSTTLIVMLAVTLAAALSYLIYVRRFFTASLRPQ